MIRGQNEICFHFSCIFLLLVHGFWLRSSLRTLTMQLWSGIINLSLWLFWLARQKYYFLPGPLLKIFIIISSGHAFDMWKIKIIGKLSCSILIAVTSAYYSRVLLFYTTWKHRKTFRFSDVFRRCRKATPDYFGLSKKTLHHWKQRCIYNPIEHLRWSFFTKSRYLFSQKRSLLDVWLGSKYAYEDDCFLILILLGPLLIPADIVKDSE